jgi:hypothetical protein
VIPFCWFLEIAGRRANYRIAKEIHSACDSEKRSR